LGCIYGRLCRALSWRGTREDDQDSALALLGAPHHGLIGSDHKAVAWLQRFVRSCDAGVESSFNHVGSEFTDAAAFADGQGDSVRYFNDLRELVSFCGGHVQGRGTWKLIAATSKRVRSASDGDGVVLRFAEEVSEADSVDGA